MKRPAPEAWLVWAPAVCASVWAPRRALDVHPWLDLRAAPVVACNAWAVAVWRLGLGYAWLLVVHKLNVH